MSCCPICHGVGIVVVRGTRTVDACHWCARLAEMQWRERHDQPPARRQPVLRIVREQETA